MVTFSVDPEGLAQLHDNLNAVHSLMQNIGQFALPYDKADLGPDGRVWDALQSFHDSWSNGFNVIEGDMEGILERLAAAAPAYRQVDDSVLKAESPQGSS